MLKGNARSLNKLMRLHFLNYILSFIIHIVTITYIVTCFFYIHWIHTLLQYIQSYIHDFISTCIMYMTCWHLLSRMLNNTKRTIPILSRVIFYMDDEAMRWTMQWGYVTTSHRLIVYRIASSCIASPHRIASFFKLFLWLFNYYFIFYYIILL